LGLAWQGRVGLVAAWADRLIGTDVFKAAGEVELGEKKAQHNWAANRHSPKAAANFAL